MAQVDDSADRTVGSTVDHAALFSTDMQDQSEANKTKTDGQQSGSECRYLHPSQYNSSGDNKE